MTVVCIKHMHSYTHISYRLLHFCLLQFTSQVLHLLPLLRCLSFLWLVLVSHMQVLSLSLTNSHSQHLVSQGLFLAHSDPAKDNFGQYPPLRDSGSTRLKHLSSSLTRSRGFIFPRGEALDRSLKCFPFSPLSTFLLYFLKSSFDQELVECSFLPNQLLFKMRQEPCCELIHQYTTPHLFRLTGSLARVRIGLMEESSKVLGVRIHCFTRLLSLFVKQTALY